MSCELVRYPENSGQMCANCKHCKRVNSIAKGIYWGWNMFFSMKEYFCKLNNCNYERLGR